MQLTLFPEPPEIQRLQYERDKLQRAQAAPTTEAGYAHDLKHFCAWCERMGRSALPATPDTLSLYITGLLTLGRTASTASRCAAGVAYAHRRRGLESPLTGEVRDILWGARRLRGEKPRQMRPITLAQLREMAASFAAEDTPLAARNRAIVVIGFASALRRSNLAALAFADLDFREEGVAIHVRREKQDQGGRGRIIGIPCGAQAASCPVRCLEAWLGHRGRHAGPLFTRLDAGAVDRRAGLTGNAIRSVVKAAIGRIGLDSAEYGPHSLRAGFITEAGERGVGHLAIAGHTGHRSLDSLRRYFRPLDVFRANACTALGM